MKSVSIAGLLLLKASVLYAASLAEFELLPAGWAYSTSTDVNELHRAIKIDRKRGVVFECIVNFMRIRDNPNVPIKIISTCRKTPISVDVKNMLGMLATAPLAIQDNTVRTISPAIWFINQSTGETKLCWARPRTDLPGAPVCMEVPDA